MVAPTSAPRAGERLLLPADELRCRIDPTQLTFESTADVEPIEGTMGQPRALEAIAFGLESDGLGYNLYVAGAAGSGRASTVLEHLERYAKTLPRPDDWIYVHNFDNIDRPLAIKLPAGSGKEFAAAMSQLIDRARQQIGHAFETERYDERRHEALAAVGAQRDALLERLRTFAQERDFVVEPTPTGFVSMPLKDGHPITPEEVQKLTDAQRQTIQRHGEEVQVEVASEIRRLQLLDHEVAERMTSLEREVALFAVDPLLQEMRDKYSESADVIAHLERIRDDIPAHLADFREPREPQQQLPATPRETAIHNDHLDRYRVNVLVDRSAESGAPIILERNPTYYNLIGRIEYQASFGMMFTDFHQVKAGALHRANGGFLVLEAADILRTPFAWDALKRALRSREVRIENLGEQLTPVPTATLAPQPIPLQVKVVLIGAPAIYRLLLALDEDFGQLFKVKADFSPDMALSDDTVHSYAAYISRTVRDSGLRHFERSAVARVIEHGARLADHQGRLSARLLDISDLVTEASFWAGKAGHKLTAAEDVDKAVAAKDRRANLVEERIDRMISEGTLMIDVSGARAGQVNGLSVAELGDYTFGMPTRITASVALGRGSVDSIDRQIELSGPIHSKGVLILSGYLAERYAQDWPLAMRATLTFEQSYEEIEGDSASSTELYALLSAISGLPIDQGIAVTGSVNQHGEIQPVGGVTQKVEGFYRVCRALGLSGNQGVIIPATNVKHLMLSDEVVKAVEEGRFRVWAVATVDESIEILTGRTAGERQADGSYPEATVHHLVAERLRGYADKQRAFAVAPNGPGPGSVAAPQ